MELSKLLKPGAVRVVGHLTSKKRLFQELGDVAAQAYGLNASIAVDGLQERESLGPTGVFALFAPKDAGVDHLKALALVSRTMRDPAICAKLRANSDPSKLHAILTEGRTNQAA